VGKQALSSQRNIQGGVGWETVEHFPSVIYSGYWLSDLDLNEILDPCIDQAALWLQVSDLAKRRGLFHPEQACLFDSALS